MNCDFCWTGVGAGALTKGGDFFSSTDLGEVAFLGDFGASMGGVRGFLAIAAWLFFF